MVCACGGCNGEYKDRNVVGAVGGGISIEEGSERYAYKKGMFVIAQSGEESIKIICVICSQVYKKQDVSTIPSCLQQIL